MYLDPEFQRGIAMYFTHKYVVRSSVRASKLCIANSRTWLAGVHTLSYSFYLLSKVGSLSESEKAVH